MATNLYITLTLICIATKPVKANRAVFFESIRIPFLCQCRSWKSLAMIKIETETSTKQLLHGEVEWAGRFFIYVGSEGKRVPLFDRPELVGPKDKIIEPIYIRCLCSGDLVWHCILGLFLPEWRRCFSIKMSKDNSKPHLIATFSGHYFLIPSFRLIGMAFGYGWRYTHCFDYSSLFWCTLKEVFCRIFQIGGFVTATLRWEGGNAMERNGTEQKL